MKALREFALQGLPSRVTTVQNSRQLDAFLAKQCVEGWRVCALLLTDKFETAPMVKALARRLKGEVQLGEVRAKNAKLSALLGVTSYPTLLFLGADAADAGAAGASSCKAAGHVRERYSGKVALKEVVAHIQSTYKPGGTKGRKGKGKAKRKGKRP